MDRFEREALDRYITGNYGEDQYRNVYCRCTHLDEDHAETNGGSLGGCLECNCFKFELPPEPDYEALLNA